MKKKLLIVGAVYAVGALATFVFVRSGDNRTTKSLLWPLYWFTPILGDLPKPNDVPVSLSDV